MLLPLMHIECTYFTIDACSWFHNDPQCFYLTWIREAKSRAEQREREKKKLYAQNTLNAHHNWPSGLDKYPANKFNMEVKTGKKTYTLTTTMTTTIAATSNYIVIIIRTNNKSPCTVQNIYMLPITAIWLFESMMIRLKLSKWITQTCEMFDLHC